MSENGFAYRGNTFAFSYRYPSSARRRTENQSAEDNILDNYFQKVKQQNDNFHSGVSPANVPNSFRPKTSLSLDATKQEYRPKSAPMMTVNTARSQQRFSAADYNVSGEPTRENSEVDCDDREDEELHQWESSMSSDVELPSAASLVSEYRMQKMAVDDRQHNSKAKRKPKRQSPSKAREKEQKKLAEREKGWVSSFPVTETKLKDYSALRDYNCRFVESKSFRNHLSKTMQLTTEEKLLLNARIKYKTATHRDVLVQADVQKKLQKHLRRQFAVSERESERLKRSDAANKSTRHHQAGDLTAQIQSIDTQERRGLRSSVTPSKFVNQNRASSATNEGQPMIAQKTNAPPDWKLVRLSDSVHMDSNQLSFDSTKQQLVRLWSEMKVPEKYSSGIREKHFAENSMDNESELLSQFNRVLICRQRVLNFIAKSKTIEVELESETRMQNKLAHQLHSGDVVNIDLLQQMLHNKRTELTAEINDLLWAISAWREDYLDWYPFTFVLDGVDYTKYLKSLLQKRSAHPNDDNESTTNALLENRSVSSNC